MVKKYMRASTGFIFTTERPEYHTNDELLTKTEGEKLYYEQCKKELLTVIKPNDIVYINVKSVSRSGMSRKMRLYVTIEGQIKDITYLASIVTGYSTDNNYNLKVSGCGMDMGFAVVYDLGHNLWQAGTPEPHGTRNGTPDYHGGYALKHSYI